MTALTRDLQGHEHQRERLQTLWGRGRIAPAMLFAGRGGIGKQLVAKELYASMLCETNRTKEEHHYGGCGTCHACKVFAHGNTPDFHIVETQDKEAWNVERIRELLFELHLRAYSGHERIVLINDADHLSVQAANILLKIIEEPREGLYFCLICQNPSRLPRTLLSRCQLWHFDPLPQQHVLTIVHERSEWQEAHASGLTTEQLVLLIDGSPGELENLAALAPHWQETTKRLESIRRGNVTLAIQFADELKSRKEALSSWLTLLRLAARHHMHQAKEPIEQYAWASCLHNTLELPYYLRERHLAPFTLFQVLFLRLARLQPSGTHLYSDHQTLDAIIGL